MLIIVSGLPGTGKTTFAKALAESLDVPHLNSDIIRDELGKRGQYDQRTTSMIYQKMYDRAAAFLQQGKSVIVDATFHKDAKRDPYLNLARAKGYPLKWIELQTQEALIRERVNTKRTYSEADFSVYQKIKSAYEPLKVPHLVLSSGELNVAQMLERTEPYLKGGNYDTC